MKKYLLKIKRFWYRMKTSLMNNVFNYLYSNTYWTFRQWKYGEWQIFRSKQDCDTFIKSRAMNKSDFRRTYFNFGNKKMIFLEFKS